MDQLEFTIQDFENKYAVLYHPIYKNLKWPIKELPAEIEIGSVVRIGMNNQTNTDENNLKKLLEDLIN